MRFLGNRSARCQGAALEDIGFKSARGLDRSLIMKLADREWIASHLNVLITGRCDEYRQDLAGALAHKACREVLGLELK